MIPRPDWCGHAIGRNHACQRPSRFVFVAVDTKQTEISGVKPYTKHELSKGSACYVHWKKGRNPKEYTFEFTKTEEWWDWLKQWQTAKGVVWVVAHDALFDYTILGLWSEIECKHYAIDRPGMDYIDPRTSQKVTSKTWRGLLAIDGRPFHVETSGHVGRVNFTDLANYYACTLDSIERMVGGANGDVSGSTRDAAGVSSQGATRVRTIKTAYLGLVKQWESGDRGNWKMSAAGLAWSHFRHRHYPVQITVHQHAEARDLEWKSYYGGEVRCYYRGNTKCGICHYDVNSLYSYVMQKYDYPTELIDYILNPHYPIVESLSKRFGIILDCTLETDSDTFPLRHDGRVVYPVGNYRTVLCGPEAIRALGEDRVTIVHAISYYRMARLFDSYVAEWYGRKRQATADGDVASASFAKMMLNSLQGKFAQRTPIWETNQSVEVIRPWKTFPWRNKETGQITPARSIGWLGQTCVQRSDKAHAFPAISAYITAYAREYMRQCRGPIAPSCLYYQDTDSLHIDSSYAESTDDCGLPIGEGIGEFRKINTYSGVIYCGPKNYTTDAGRVVSGVKVSDLKIADNHYVGKRTESTAAIVSREPDGTIRENTIHTVTPGTCNEGGYSEDGYYYPLVLGR